MPDPRREPFPDETQIDPDSPNRRARERIDEVTRTRAPGARDTRRAASASGSDRARDKP